METAERIERFAAKYTPCACVAFARECNRYAIEFQDARNITNRNRMREFRVAVARSALKVS